ncbi:AraC family transcriptional regulator [Aquimarina macrocephali]|uniref:AraC family transcriptional regulator n=1 Tax=Aquimarina macrocephali TaxID=666563 RepID=UPI0013781668|nr:AraC family transcriptional regulator [Aquimarina macrocephali]
MIILLINQYPLYCQNISSKVLDSLIKLEYKELSEGYGNNFDTNHIKARLYANALLQKGKKEKNDLGIITGLYYLGTLYPNNLEKRIIYIDSAINIATSINNEGTLVFLKTHKGTVYETAAFFDIALDNYLESLELAKKTNDSDYIAILQHNIAVLKRKFGKYEEAKSLFKEALNYEKLKMGKQPNDSLSYLLTLSDLANTYRQNKELDSAAILNKQGMIMSNGKIIQSLFRLNKGILHYYSEEYTVAIKNIVESLKIFRKPESNVYFATYDLIDAYFFLGKSYDALSNKEQSIIYYKKIDSVLQQTNYLIPKIRSAYSEIIKYYKSIGDKNNQLYYINRLLYNDSIIDRNYKDINNKLIKEYDTPILFSEKEKLIYELEAQKNKSHYGIIVLLIITMVIIVVFILNHRRNKKYKTRFEELMDQKNKEFKNENIKSDPGIGIADQIVEMILKELETFEKYNDFLEINITSGILAKKMNTNSKYLTKVIKYHRKKTFTTYINDLRIDHIVQQLKTDRKLQNYTIKAIASEAGFNSTEVFSKSFLKKTGIYPSYFIKRIQS